MGKVVIIQYYIGNHSHCTLSGRCPESGLGDEHLQNSWKRKSQEQKLAVFVQHYSEEG